MRTCGATGVPPWGTHGPGGVVLTDLQSLLDVNKLLSLSLSLSVCVCVCACVSLGRDILIF